ncbi:hypothetical protein [Rheinheimera baltica]|uniref:hypothetical protein n=1 Tax=Rheinheimera baltica TaxID=67576 RepID=UPI00273FE600|nr:hypothetical protein [Rheinheimera baltica]MDP5191804.1 hypothetical protein [Rheinheimera baltica]
MRLLWALGQKKESADERKNMIESKPPIEDKKLTETMKFSAYSVRSVAIFETYPLDPAQFRDLKTKQPVMSIIASALTGGAIAWAVTFGGKYLDPNTSPERWEEIMLVVISIAACVFHTMAGTVGNNEKREVMKQIDNFFKSNPREAVSISSTVGDEDEK